MPRKSKIGLALGSGGWRGLAHIGVIKSLVKHGFEISAIAGSSSGALIGGLFALTQNIEQVETMFNALKYPDILSAFSDPSAKLGLFSGKNTIKLFNKYTHHATIEQLRIPFAAVASDIVTGQSVVISQGDLASAIRASSSVPIIFEPVSYHQHLLIDGGVTHPVPVDIAQTLGADIVIGVDVYSSMFSPKAYSIKLSKINVINLSYHLLLSKLSAIDATKADLVIKPQIANLALDPFSRFINNQQTIDQGEIAMDESIDQLTRLTVFLSQVS